MNSHDADDLQCFSYRVLIVSLGAPMDFALGRTTRCGKGYEKTQGTTRDARKNYIRRRAQRLKMSTGSAH